MLGTATQRETATRTVTRAAAAATKTNKNSVAGDPIIRNYNYHEKIDSTKLIYILFKEHN